MRLPSGILLTVLAFGSAAPAMADPGGLIEPEALPGLMVTPEDAKAVMGTGMSVIFDGSMLVDHDSNRPECGSVVLASNQSYSDHGYSAVQHRTLTDGQPWYALVEQNTALLDSTQEAHDFVVSEADRWRACAGQTVSVTVTVDGGARESQRYAIRQVFQQDDVVIVGYTWGPDYCQHALAAARNAVIDIRTCSGYSKAGGDHAADLLLRLKDRIFSA